MPSLNHIVPISATRRIRVNVCEGEVHAQEEDRSGRGMWVAVAGRCIGPISREHAEALANTILTGLKAGY